ncbi:MAG: hypothetical protein QOD27_2092, partial [Microbacteriaceae bacterium]|nr:hypothetical protein [Microbacteriaceae bacterium]
VFNAHYTDLLAVGANKSDLRHADSVIGTGIADALLLLRCSVSQQIDGCRAGTNEEITHRILENFHLIRHGTLTTLGTFVTAGGAPTTR